MVEDLDDLGLLDAGHALRLLGVVDEQHAPARRRDQVRARDEADRAALRVDHHRGAVVALLDLLGDLVDQELGGGGQRVALHQRAAGRGQRDHPARDVAVERRDDHRDPVLPRPARGSRRRARSRWRARAAGPRARWPGAGRRPGCRPRPRRPREAPLRVGSIECTHTRPGERLVLAGEEPRRRAPRRSPRRGSGRPAAWRSRASRGCSGGRAPARSPRRPARRRRRPPGRARGLREPSRGRPRGSAPRPWRSGSSTASRRRRGPSRGGGTAARRRRCARAASASARCTRPGGPAT